MTMEDWAKRIDSYLSSDERPLLDNAGSVTHEYAKEYAETEFERYRIIQDRLFRSDLEKMQLDGSELPGLPFEGAWGPSDPVTPYVSIREIRVQSLIHHPSSIILNC